MAKLPQTLQYFTIANSQDFRELYFLVKSNFNEIIMEWFVTSHRVPVGKGAMDAMAPSSFLEVGTQSLNMVV